MIKREKITSLLPCLIVLSFFFWGCNTKTDWRENYRERSKDPFGTYIIANETEHLFSDNNFTLLNKHIYDYFNDIYYEDEANIANYICIKSTAYRLDEESLEKLLKFVASGNDVFLSLNYFNDYLKESLKFDTTNLDEEVYSVEDLRDLESTFTLKNKQFKNTTFKFDRNIRKNYFSKYDTLTTTILGTQKIDRVTSKPNFIKIRHFNGNIFLHTQPIAFTNYYLLNKNENYASNAFSYLPNREIIWDPQIRRSTSNKNQDDGKSALQFFMKHPSLKWSLYLGFFGLIAFLLFNARRKQRAIPEMKSLKNSTKDFTHTIANLYKKEENHKNLATKKITYFLEKIRTKYHIETRNLNDDFINKLAAKSGNTVHTTKYLTNTIIALNKRYECSQDELVRLNTLIENFLQKK